MSTLPLSFQKAEASLSRDPYYYKVFDIHDTDLENARSSKCKLALRPSYASSGTSTKEYLQPIIDAGKRSTGALGRLTTSDVEKLQKHGSCTHNKIVVLLLEPTKYSEDTISHIGSFLRLASKGVLDEHNTAIINCRALIPNASFNDRYSDSSRTGEYNFRAVKKSLKALSPDVILVCQCSVDKNVDTFLSRLTKHRSKAGDTTFMKFNGKNVHVVHAFHPSVFTKYRGADGAKAELDKAVLLFCFMLAVNLSEGIDVVGDGLGKLRDLIRRVS